MAARRILLAAGAAAGLTFTLAGVSALQAQNQASRPAHAPADVSDGVLRRAADYPADWLTYANSYRGHRYSSLSQVTRDNVRSLTPRWCFSLGTLGAQQCTPIVHRGVMYVTSAGGKINAIKADTGELIWEFDAQLPEDAIKYGPDSNRGAAIWNDRVIWNSIIGTTYCHDAKTGKVLWKVTPDYYRLGFSKTFAPLIVKGKVITGIGGGEYGVRGFLEAWDANTGKRAWKTYTIPGPGEPGHETWPRDNDSWEHGGGPTWITGSYDPELNLIYWTTGNAGPWAGQQRRGDNLYTCSLLALDADTGRIRWHYQFVQNDAWDYDCNVTPVLTELEHEGARVPVVALAVKNGFLYVLDRRNGRFLKGAQVGETITWARGLDPKTGRALEAPSARPKPEDKKPIFVAPSALGVCNWWGMAFYPPQQRMILVLNETGNDLVWDPVEYNPGEPFSGLREKEFPDVTRRTQEKPGRVCAWDLRTMKKVWEAEQELEVRWGGPLATAGGLVFAGTLRGYLQAMDVDTGKRLWQFQTGSGIMAFPVTYAVEGKQYVAIVSGKGGVANPASLSQDFFKFLPHHHSAGNVFAFALP